MWRPSWCCGCIGGKHDPFASFFDSDHEPLDSTVLSWSEWQVARIPTLYTHTCLQACLCSYTAHMFTCLHGRLGEMLHDRRSWRARRSTACWVSLWTGTAAPASPGLCACITGGRPIRPPVFDLVRNGMLMHACCESMRAWIGAASRLRQSCRGRRLVGFDGGLG